MRHILIYSLIRIAIFFVVWEILHVLTPFAWPFTGIMAAAIAMLLSILFLGRFRQSVAVDLQHTVQKRQEKRKGIKTEFDVDADDEDALIDAENARIESRETKTA